MRRTSHAAVTALCISLIVTSPVFAGFPWTIADMDLTADAWVSIYGVGNYLPGDACHWQTIETSYGDLYDSDGPSSTSADAFSGQWLPYLGRPTGSDSADVQIDYLGTGTDILAIDADIVQSANIQFEDLDQEYAICVCANNARVQSVASLSMTMPIDVDVEVYFEWLGVTAQRTHGLSGYITGLAGGIVFTPGDTSMGTPAMASYTDPDTYEYVEVFGSNPASEEGSLLLQLTAPLAANTDVQMDLTATADSALYIYPIHSGCATVVAWAPYQAHAHVELVAH